MQAHRILVTIPDDHRLVVEIPEEIRTGPAELIVLVPVAASNVEGRPSEPGRLTALATELAADSRSFRELSDDERCARLERVMGVGRGLLSTSREFAQHKREEVEREESKLAR